MACGKGSMETATWANGAILKLMGMECISGKTEIGTREVGAIVSNMEKAVTFLLTETLILVNIKMEGQMAKVCISGKMGAYTQVILKME